MPFFMVHESVMLKINVVTGPLSLLSGLPPPLQVSLAHENELLMKFVQIIYMHTLSSHFLQY